MCYFMKKRLTAFVLMLCMAFTSVPAFALEGETGTGVPGTEVPGTEVPGTEVPGTEVPEVPEVVSASISMQGDTQVYVGKSMTVKATIAGLSAPVSGVSAVWTVNGQTVKTETIPTMQNGTKLALEYTVPETTTAASNTVALALTLGPDQIGYATTQVTNRFGFAGAVLKPGKQSYATVGRTKRVTMKLTGLKASFKGTYQWYIDGKAKTKHTVTISNNKTFELKYKPTKSGTDKIQLVLRSADGKISMKSPVKTLKIYSQYAKTLSSYTTYFTTSNYNRCVNMRKVVSAINGKVIQPGKTFSLNKATGKRTGARGYRKSIVFAGSRQVYGYGGGTCQVVSTLFNTVLLANMTITERHNHSQSVSYIAKGRDAAVGGWKDFRFKNNLSVPVKIVATYNSRGSITIKLKADYGTKTKPVKLKVTRSNGYYVLRRYANNKLNYTTRSRH